MSILGSETKITRNSQLKEVLSQIKDLFRKGLNRQFSGCVLEAYDLYKQATEKLRAILDDKRHPLKGELLKRWTFHLKHFEGYMENLSDQLHGHITQSKMVDQIFIKEDEVGYSYQNLFGRYLTGAVKDILIFEPELSKGCHIKNLINFFEMILKNCANVSCIRLVTNKNGELPTTQLNILNQVCLDMERKNIDFSYRFEDNLKDAKILLSNGYLINTGHGLHIYQPDYAQYSPGLCDFDFRKCFKSMISIWKCRPFADGSYLSIKELEPSTRKKPLTIENISKYNEYKNMTAAAELKKKTAVSELSIKQGSRSKI
ncbi:MIT domain-containing protein 1-like isoform X2 [Teleopsis dalmanni]|uniref:MIT domain-containing protein 1-like isoform X1 n=1 Tax=Teleopsis dalmanni TaxID=139649 RepID=UPI0018CFB0FD|nr:MIT domain-containing protein 1-like isoform X1 [Teleopsis dalmanni]XP_037954368.1 MIT domain-containing protein 1-like isoform X2 [Teleopsis dalmanni]